MSDDDKITNKDINNTLTQMKDNHLNHIQRNTEDTNKLLNKIWWIFLGAFIFFAGEEIIMHIWGIAH